MPSSACPTYPESSLRIRRVPGCSQRWTGSTGIIPPHTEGTYRSRRNRRQQIESSLRIRRVRYIMRKDRAGVGIIPPHTEGTTRRQNYLPAGANHPSAYGGYSIWCGIGKCDKESSLRIRRVRTSAFGSLCAS